MRFQDLFRSYTKSHGIYKMLGTYTSSGKAEGKAFTVKGPPNDAAWDLHLTGKGNGLGLIPLMDDNHSVCWGALDIDKYPIDHAALERDCAKLPLTLTKSKSGGAHLWLFLKEPTPASLVISKMSEWAALLGAGGCEVFPKQHRRIADNDVGNWINLPYYGDQRRAIFEGKEVELEKFLEITEKRLVTQSILEKITVTSDEGNDGQFKDGPPCLQVLTKLGISEGGRNNALFNVGVYLKMKYPENWKDLIREWNKANISPPLPEHEIPDMIKTLERKEYNYTCSKHPIKQHCNRPLCIRRDFGIAKGNANNDEINVILSGLTKIDTTNPRYLINIDGTRTELGDVEDLVKQDRFSLVVTKRINKMMKPVSLGKWREIVQGLLDKVETVEAPPEASPEGQFFLYLNNYIEIRQTDSKDAIAQGNVWVDKGVAYFTSKEFNEYLRREGFRDLKMNQTFALMHERGVEKARFNIKGKTVACWSVKLESLQTDPFDVPTFGQNVFGDNDAPTN